MPQQGKASLLLVDDDPDLLRLLAIRLKANGYAVTAMENGRKALASIAASRPDLVLTDLRMEGMDGMALFTEIQATYPGLPVIILTAHGSIPDAVGAVKRGVFGYLTKPYDADELLSQIQRALTLHGGGAMQAGPGQVWREDIVTRSTLMEDLLAKAQRVAAGDASVLIQGDSGTGKELLARAIHRASPRANHPFVAINCGAIPETLLESELFGHTKGSFTGAIADQPGLFVAANKGTLVLDEIGDIGGKLQLDLLRVLEERKFHRIGGNENIEVDVRIIAATNRDLRKAVAEGKFREDLFYRLNVIPITLPPVRQRREDLPLLVDSILERLAVEMKKRLDGVSAEAMAAIMAHDWPGNVRELRNVLERGAVVAQGPTLQLHDLGMGGGEGSKGEAPRTGPLASLEDMERRHVAAVLAHTGGNVSQSARILGIDRVTLYNKMKRYGIRRDGEDEPAKAEEDLPSR